MNGSKTDCNEINVLERARRHDSMCDRHQGQRATCLYIQNENISLVRNTGTRDKTESELRAMCDLQILDRAAAFVYTK